MGGAELWERLRTERCELFEEAARVVGESTLALLREG